MFEFYQEFEDVLSSLGMTKEITLIHQHIARKRPPIDDILGKLKIHRFIIKDLEYDQFNYKFANGTAMLNHYFIRLAFMDSWIKLLPKDNVETVFDLIEQHLNEKSKILGGLNLSIPFVLINAIKQ